MPLPPLTLGSDGVADQVAPAISLPPLTLGAEGILDATTAKTILAQRSVEDLALDKEFDPTGFAAAHYDELVQDNASMNILAQVTKAKKLQAFDPVDFGVGAFKGAVGAVVGAAKGLWAVAKAAPTIAQTPIASIAAELGHQEGTGPRELTPDEKAGQRSMAEATAATESSFASMGDEARKFIRFLSEKAPGTKSVREYTDDEWRQRFNTDVESRKQLQDTQAGRGVGAKAIGLTEALDDLKKQGVEIRPEEIQDLQGATDLVTYWGLFKGLGVVKQGVTAGGRAALALPKAVPLAAKVPLSVSAPTWLIEKAGAGTAKVGEAVESLATRAQQIPGVTRGLAGAVMGGSYFSPATMAATVVGPWAAKYAGKGVRAVGEAIEGAAPAIAKSGVVQGTLHSIPIAAAFAVPQDTSEAMGEAFGGAVAFGTMFGGLSDAKKAALKAGQTAGTRLARDFFKSLEAQDVRSPNYEPTEGATADWGNLKLDLADLNYKHDQNVRSGALSKLRLNWVNTFRELFRPNARIYVVRGPEFRSITGADHAGVILENTKLDNGGAADILLVNADAKLDAIAHEPGHMLMYAAEKTNPKAFAGLITEIVRSFGADGVEAYRRAYETSTGKTVTEAEGLHEMAAELIGKELYNEPFTGDSRGWADKMREWTGLALETSGLWTPSPSVPTGAENRFSATPFGIQPSFRVGRAAREVVQGGISQAAVDALGVQRRQAGTPVPLQAVPVQPMQGPQRPPAPPVQLPLPFPPTTPPAAPVPPPVAGPLPTPPPAPPATPTAPPAPPVVFPGRTTPDRSDIRRPRTAEDAQVWSDVKNWLDTNRPDLVKTAEQIEQALGENGVFEAIYASVKEAATAGRAQRKSAQDIAYAIEDAAPWMQEADRLMQGMSSETRALFLKKFVPVRWALQMREGAPVGVNLRAYSLDKAVSNMGRLAEFVSKNIAPELQQQFMPYELEGGALTERGWRDFYRDLGRNNENQQRGWRGDGTAPLPVPESAHVVVPPVDPTWDPVRQGTVLTPLQMQVINMVQGGLGTTMQPAGGRLSKPRETIAGEKKWLIEARRKDPETGKRAIVEEPANIRVRPIAGAGGNVGVWSPFSPKTGAKTFELSSGDLSILEFNPIRYGLVQQVGVAKVKGLLDQFHAVTENLNLEGIGKITAQPGRGLAPGVTDFTRAGFAAGERVGPVSEELRSILDASPEQWSKTTAYKGTLGSGYTGMARDFGATLRTPEQLGELRAERERRIADFDQARSTLAETMDFDGVMLKANKKQFVDEAIEAAVGDPKVLKDNPDYVPPLSEQRSAASAGSRTEEAKRWEYLAENEEQLDRFSNMRPGGFIEAADRIKQDPISMEAAQRLLEYSEGSTTRQAAYKGEAGDTATRMLLDDAAKALEERDIYQIKRQWNADAEVNLLERAARAILNETQVTGMSPADQAIGEIAIQSSKEARRGLASARVGLANAMSTAGRITQKVEEILREPAFGPNERAVKLLGESGPVEPDVTGERVPAMGGFGRQRDVILADRAARAQADQDTIDTATAANAELRTEEKPVLVLSMKRDPRGKLTVETVTAVGEGEYFKPTPPVGGFAAGERKLFPKDYTIVKVGKRFELNDETGQSFGFDADTIQALYRKWSNTGDAIDRKAAAEAGAGEEGVPPPVKAGVLKLPEGEGPHLGGAYKMWFWPDTQKLEKIGRSSHESDLAESKSERSKSMGIEIFPEDLNATRLSALSKGLARVNYNPRGGELTVEVVDKNFRGPMKDALRELVAANADKIDSLTLSKLNSRTMRWNDQAVNMVGMDRAEKLESLPFQAGERAAPPAEPTVKDVAAEFAKALTSAIRGETPTETPQRPTITPDLTRIVRGIKTGKEFGATFNADMTVFTPSGGSALDTVSLASVNLPIRGLTMQKVIDALQPYVSVLELPDVKPGLFKMDNGKDVSVDVNVLVDQEHRANTLKFARANEQQSIWDNVAGENIPTGGSGKTRINKVDAMIDAADELVAGRPVNVEKLAPAQGVFPGMEEIATAPTKLSRETTKHEADSWATGVEASFPEIIRPEPARTSRGRQLYDPSGRPTFERIPYDLEAGPKIKGDTREARTDSLAEAVAAEVKTALKDEAVAAGREWYKNFRELLFKNFKTESDALLFGQLLASTSAGTSVKENFLMAIEAYNRFKQGQFDDLVKHYIAGENMMVTGELANAYAAEKGLEKSEATGEYRQSDVAPHKLLNWWIERFGLVPVKRTAKREGKDWISARFSMHGIPVLKALAGYWVGSQKTNNFAKNLTGQGFRATIDLWASRTLRRLGYDTGDTRWRIHRESEMAPTPGDFGFSQDVFDRAAEIVSKETGKQWQADAVQAVLWFAEKQYYDRKGWTKGVGSELSDFSAHLREYTQAPEGYLYRKEAGPAEGQMTIPGNASAWWEGLTLEERSAARTAVQKLNVEAAPLDPKSRKALARELKNVSLAKIDYTKFAKAKEFERDE